MIYTKAERLEIGRQVYYNELTADAAAEQYKISSITIMKYARLFRDENELPRKPSCRKKTVDLSAKILKKESNQASLADYMAMSKDELIHELIAARINEVRLKKGYEVKGVGPEKKFVPLGNKNTK